MQRQVRVHDGALFDEFVHRLLPALVLRLHVDRHAGAVAVDDGLAVGLARRVDCLERGPPVLLLIG
jgi:hypothetical protein